MPRVTTLIPRENRALKPPITGRTVAALQRQSSEVNFRQPGRSLAANATLSGGRAKPGIGFFIADGGIITFFRNRCKQRTKQNIVPRRGLCYNSRGETKDEMSHERKGAEASKA